MGENDSTNAGDNKNSTVGTDNQNRKIEKAQQHEQQSAGERLRDDVLKFLGLGPSDDKSQKPAEKSPKPAEAENQKLAEKVEAEKQKEKETALDRQKLLETTDKKYSGIKTALADARDHMLKLNELCRAGQQHSKEYENTLKSGLAGYQKASDTAITTLYKTDAQGKLVLDEQQRPVESQLNQDIKSERQLIEQEKAELKKAGKEGTAEYETLLKQDKKLEDMQRALGRAEANQAFGLLYASAHFDLNAKGNERDAQSLIKAGFNKMLHAAIVDPQMLGDGQHAPDPMFRAQLKDVIVKAGIQDDMIPEEFRPLLNADTANTDASAKVDSTVETKAPAPDAPVAAGQPAEAQAAGPTNETDKQENKAGDQGKEVTTGFKGNTSETELIKLSADGKTVTDLESGLVLPTGKDKVAIKIENSQLSIIGKDPFALYKSAAEHIQGNKISAENIKEMRAAIQAADNIDRVDLVRQIQAKAKELQEITTTFQTKLDTERQSLQTLSNEISKKKEAQSFINTESKVLADLDKRGQKLVGMTKSPTEEQKQAISRIGDFKSYQEFQAFLESSKPDDQAMVKQLESLKNWQEVKSEFGQYLNVVSQAESLKKQLADNKPLADDVAFVKAGIHKISQAEVTVKKIQEEYDLKATVPAAEMEVLKNLYASPLILRAQYFKLLEGQNQDQERAATANELTKIDSQLKSADLLQAGTSVGKSGTDKTAASDTNAEANPELNHTKAELPPGFFEASSDAQQAMLKFQQYFSASKGERLDAAKWKEVSDQFKQAIAKADLLTPEVAESQKKLLKKELADLIPNEAARNNLIQQHLDLTQKVSRAEDKLSPEQTAKVYEAEAKLREQLHGLQAKQQAGKLSQEDFAQKIAELEATAIENTKAIDKDYGEATANLSTLINTQEGFVVHQYNQQMERLNAPTNIRFMYATAMSSGAPTEIIDVEGKALAQSLLANPELAHKMQSTLGGLNMARSLGLQASDLPELRTGFPELDHMKKAGELLADPKNVTAEQFQEAQKYFRKAIDATTAENNPAYDPAELANEIETYKKKLSGNDATLTEADQTALFKQLLIAEQRLDNVAQARYQYAIATHNYALAHGDEKGQKEALQKLNELNAPGLRERYYLNAGTQGAIHQMEQHKPIDEAKVKAIGQIAGAEKILKLGNTVSLQIPVMGSFMQKLMEPVGATSLLNDTTTKIAGVPLKNIPIVGHVVPFIPDNQATTDAAARRMAAARLDNQTAAEEAYLDAVSKRDLAWTDTKAHLGALGMGFTTRALLNTQTVNALIDRVPNPAVKVGLKGLTMLTPFAAAGATESYIATGTPWDGNRFVSGAGQYTLGLGLAKIHSGLNPALSAETRLAAANRVGASNLEATSTRAMLKEASAVKGLAPEIAGPRFDLGLTRKTLNPLDNPAQLFADGHISLAAARNRAFLQNIGTWGVTGYTAGAGSRTIDLFTAKNDANGNPYNGIDLQARASNVYDNLGTIHQQGKDSALVSAVAAPVFWWGLTAMPAAAASLSGRGYTGLSAALSRSSRPWLNTAGETMSNVPKYINGVLARPTVSTITAVTGGAWNLGTQQVRMNAYSMLNGYESGYQSRQLRNGWEQSGSIVNDAMTQSQNILDGKTPPSQAAPTEVKPNTPKPQTPETQQSPQPEQTSTDPKKNGGNRYEDAE